MNDETRTALVEVIEAELDSYCPSPFNGAFAVSLMPIIERLLTTRPEPAADAIERAAKAITSIWNKPSPNPTAFPASAETLARAALQAAAVEPEPGPGLDELLDSVHQKAMISFVFQHDSEPWIAGVRWPYTDELPIDSQTFASAEGTGPTRIDAIADAVRQAKGTEGSA